MTGDVVPTHRVAKRRSVRRRLLIGLGIVLAVLLVLAGGAYWYIDSRIQTFDASGISKNRPADDRATDVLLIGSDARGGENSRLGGPGTTVGRSDTAILVHVYPGSRRAVAVSIPRDSLVTIPRCKLPDGSWTRPQHDTMFNSAFSVGGTPQGNPSCTVNTVEKMTGLRIDHTVVANFAGFAAMSHAVGGVPVCVPNPVYQGDLNPNLGRQGNLVFRAGPQTVEGARALQYVRVRHGIGDGSDIGRIKRQQAFLGSLLSTIKSKGLEPSHILPLINAATANLTFDPSLDNPAKLFSFAMGLVHVKLADVDFLTVPWRYDGARVAIVRPAAQALWSALRANAPLVSTVHSATGHGHSGHRARQHALPASVTHGMRTATSNICSNLTYG